MTEAGKLTVSRIQQWIRQGKPVAGKSDGNGLTFTMSAAQVTKGEGTWVLRFAYFRTRKEMTLGRYPALDLAAAREAAGIERARVFLGSDIAAEKQVSRHMASNARYIETLQRNVAKAEAELKRFKDAVQVAKLRLSAARKALQAEQGKRDSSWAS